MIMKFVYLFTILMLLTSCNAPTSSATQKEEVKQTNPPVFKMIDIPGILTNSNERAEYLVKNYWNKFDFSDTTFLSYPDVIEQAFVDYIDVFPYAKKEVVAASLKKMMENAGVEKKMFTHFFDLYEKYLYDPNSPMRNEEFFIPVLEAAIASPALDETSKIRPQSLLELAQKNREGTRANDFTFTLANGQQQSLYKQNAEYILLYFYNPGCPACEETSGKMKTSPLITHLTDSKRLKIIAVYPDEDLEEWEKHLSEIPTGTGWITGYDQDVYIKNEEVYDLKAIPTLYLLDKNKQVLLKDPIFEQIEAFLSNK
jgi:AhpC/TSA family.